MKIKIGESWGTREHRDLERVALAREVIGPGTELYVDANGGYTADHERIERMFFDGALDPDGGVLTPDPGQPGLGLTLRDSDAERYRRD